MAAFQSSGLSLAEFAWREGLHIERLRRWRRRLERGVAASGPEFVELVAAAASAAPVEIVLRSGRVLRVGEAIAVTSLRRLVEVLEEEPSC
jgi:transposase-like protein